MTEEKKGPEVEASKTEVPEVETKVEEQEEQEASLKEAEKKTGIKETGVNQAAVDEAKDTEPVKKEAAPVFFVEDDDVMRVEVDILFDKADGKLVSVSRSGVLDAEDFNTLGFCKEWFDFHPVGYEEMSNYRQRCSVYRQDANRSLVDPVALRNYLLVWHLKDWSMRDRNGKKKGLKFADSGALTDETIVVVYKTNTTMLDVVLTLFEKDMMM